MSRKTISPIILWAHDTINSCLCEILSCSRSTKIVTRNEETFIVVHCEDKIPSELVEAIKNKIFFADEISEVLVDSIMKVSNHNISIRLTRYPEFVEMQKTLREFSADITRAEFRKNEFVFDYVLNGKHNLNFDELEKLQNIVNASIKNHDSIRVSYSGGISTMWTDLNKRTEHID